MLRGLYDAARHDEMMLHETLFVGGLYDPLKTAVVR